MKPAVEMFLTPVIGITCFAVILLSWFGGVKYRGIPAGLVAIAVGTAIAWGSNLFGYNFGGMTTAALGESLKGFGFSVPLPAFGHVFGGFEYLGILLVTAIPFGIYDLVEAIDNVESAEVAGDSFPTTRVLTADGVISLIGCVMGNPFINAVYIGHPGWKSMGGRIGYSAATGVAVIILTWFGIVSVMLALIPTIAILPILLYIGMLIGSQAFQETPKRHAPAIVLSLAPHLAHWVVTLIGGALAASGTVLATLTPEAKQKLFDSMKVEGVMFHGLEVLGGGSILGGLILGSIAVFIIDRNFLKAGAFAGAGAILTFFGFMHGDRLGFGQSPTVAFSYLIVAGILLAAAKFAVVEPVVKEAGEDLPHGHSAPAPDPFPEGAGAIPST
jgi:AGZA family xanthine/uracil permease-like MFS transporter